MSVYLDRQKILLWRQLDPDVEFPATQECVNFLLEDTCRERVVSFSSETVSEFVWNLAQAGLTISALC